MRIAALVLPACVFLALPLHAQRTVEQRAAAGSGPVRIHNMVGSVRVIGWDRDSIVVTGTVQESPTERFIFHVGEGGAKMGVWDAGNVKLRPSHLEIRVPSASTVWVKAAGSDITVEGVTGSLDLYAVSGRIEVTGSPSEIRAESMSGELHIDTHSRSVHAKTATASITLRGQLNDLTATTVSGDIAVVDASLQRGRFEAINGDIRFSGSVDANTTLDFITHGGAVELAVPRDASAEFLIATFEGGFEDRFGVRTTATGSQLKGREIRFRLGDSGIGGQVSVRSFKGRVLLEAR
jgi:hypothetical protein